MSSRTLFTRETGHIIINPTDDENKSTHFAEGSISLELVEETVDLPSLLFGVIDKVPVGRMVKLKYIPQEFSTGAVQVLFPHRNLLIGQSIFGADDIPVDVHTVSGKRVRILSAAVYKEPEIRGDIKKTPFGEVEWWGILPIDGDPDTLASYLVESSAPYPGASGFDPTRAITPAWQCSWGASPFDAIDLTEGGFSLKSTSKLEEDKPMGKGLCNVVLTDYSLEVSFQPMNVTRDQVMARMGWDVPLGGRKSAAAADFIAQANGIYLQAYNMHLSKPDAFQFDSKNMVAGKLTLSSTKTIIIGTRSSMLYLDTGD